MSRAGVGKVSPSRTSTKSGNKSKISASGTKSRVNVSAGSPPPKIGLEKPQKGLEWTLPPFSVCRKDPATVDGDALVENLLRRQDPDGEDLNAIRLILKELKGKKIPIHDFINFVSPYTSDNGKELREGLIQDLKTFQEMCRNIYHTMTQDVSDVLINEQMQTVEYYHHKHDESVEKMMKIINEIYDMIPTFDFEKYYNKKQAYLNVMLKIPPATSLDKDADAMAQRQKLYHRLQWLRNEGERMTEENNQLEKRLQKLKEQHAFDQKLLSDAAAAEEAKAAKLQEEENKMRNKLEKLNMDIEKTIITSEAQTLSKFNATSLSSERHVEAPVQRKKKKKEEWATIVAEEIETENVQEVIASEKEILPLEPNLRKMRRDEALLKQLTDNPYLAEYCLPKQKVTPRQHTGISFNPDFNAPQKPSTPSEVFQETQIEKSNIICQNPRACPERRGRKN